MAGATLTMTALQIVQSIQGGKAEAQALEYENEQDYIATIGAEADRKYELNKSIASQIAYGADPGGSHKAITDRQRDREKQDTQRDRYMHNLRSQGRKVAARTAKNTSYWKAGGQALTGVTGAAGNLKLPNLGTGVGTKITSTTSKQKAAFANPYGA
jgi:hypothetical protein